LGSENIKDLNHFLSTDLPDLETNKEYSLSWNGFEPGETWLELIESMIDCLVVTCVNESLREMKTWNSMSFNLLMADKIGNIAYQMLASCPKRQNGYPFLGASVFDGAKSQYDWEGFTKIDEYPFVMNPDKGYFVSANNRIVPENSKFDHGAS